MPVTAVFLLSASTLAIEILLTRVFSMSQWHHLSFMVISIALLGFAASGTVHHLAVVGRRASVMPNIGIRKLIAAYTVSAVAALVITQTIPLDYVRLPLEPIQWAHLAVTYAMLALPFFFAGLVMSLAYASHFEKSGFIYAAAMTGSAAGAALPALLVGVLGEIPLILLAAAMPLAAVPVSRGPGHPHLRLAAGAITACLAVAALVTAHHGAPAPRLNPYKKLFQLKQYPDTRIMESSRHLMGRVDRVDSPHIRFAPGLSLSHTSRLPTQQGIYVDGDRQNVICGDQVAFARDTLAYAPYVRPSSPAPRVLVLMENGGLAVACARAARARRITLIHRHPGVAAHLCGHPRVQVQATAPRRYLSGTHDAFDVVHIADWGPSLPGTASMHQSDVLTVEAFMACLQRLTPTGTLAVNRRLLLPPSDMLRLWATAHEALARMGRGNPAGHMVILRNWDTYTLLVSPMPMSDLPALTAFAENKHFDVVFAAGTPVRGPNRYNVFDAPYHHDAVRSLAAAYARHRAADHFDRHMLDIAPQADNRGFPSRFMKWSHFNDYHRTAGRRLYRMLLSGEVVIAAVFAEALALTGLLLVMPVIILKGPRRLPNIRHSLLFLGLGAGFMLAEMALIKAMTLVTGDPVTSLSAVLAGLLVFSGIGGMCSQRLGVRRLAPALLIATAWMIVMTPMLMPAMQGLLGLSRVAQWVAALVLLAVTGVVIGVPFPLAMRCWLAHPAQRAHAWAANGCTSVLAAVAAAQISMSSGIDSILPVAAGAYVMALIAVLGRR